MKYSTITTKKGFTLVETLVAISILLLAIIGPMTIAQRGIQSSYFATEQVTAVFLAQEAIEAVRQLRDEQGLRVYEDPDGEDADEWIIDIYPKCAAGCAYVAETRSFESCFSSNNCVVKIDENKVYTHLGSGADTEFSRIVYAGLVGNTVSYFVDVSWKPSLLGGVQKRVRLQTWLYNQYSRFEET